MPASLLCSVFAYGIIAWGKMGAVRFESYTSVLGLASRAQRPFGGASTRQRRQWAAVSGRTIRQRSRPMGRIVVLLGWFPQ